MANLAINFLGDLEVIRDGAAVPLPPSRKTRALLAYLALHPRPFRREHLCELLWEVPDDPRGSLRWSLSKLRRLVDHPDRPRIVADRLQVGFDAAGVDIDIVTLGALTGAGLERAPLADLEAAAARHRGSFLEGLDLPGFHDFHTWCITQRERAARLRSELLNALVLRLAGEPERSLPYARALVGLAPYDEVGRAQLIRLLVATGRAEEAEQQYHLGVRMLEEVGVDGAAALFEARRSAPSRAGAARIRRPAEDPAPHAGAGAGDGRLFGREGEIARLDAAFRGVRDGATAGLVLLRGEPGIGKTRLLEAVAASARAAGALLLEAGSFEADAIRPFGLWTDAFRRLGSGVELFESDGADNRDRLFGRLSERIAGEAARRPVVLLFDDLHWCDESSAAALHYVARMNRQTRLFGVLAAREDELRDNGSVVRVLRGLRHDQLLEELKVGPLTEDAARRLIETHAPAADAGRLSRECAGNPLLAIELARAESGIAHAASLAELVRERVARFDAEGAEVLQWAAVLAPRIDAAALARVTGLDPNRIGKVLESADRQAILRAAGHGMQFAHDMVARSIYADIAPARRQVMHRRVAELLEQDAAVDLDRAADLVHHAVQSGDDALAASAMVLAGRLCLRFFANDDALALARRGLQIAEGLPAAERVCLTLELHDVLLTAAPLEDQEAAADQLVRLAEQALDHGAVGHARLGYQMASFIRWMQGNWSSAREQSLQAERVTRGAGDEEHIIGMAEAARCLAMLERDLGQADALLMEAQALAVRRNVVHHAMPLAHGMLQLHANRLDAAEESFQEGRTLAKSAGDRVCEFQANEYLVMIDVARQRFEAARARCEVLLELGEKLREGSEAPFARALAGLCGYALEDAIEPLDAALEDLRLVDAKHRLAYVLTQAALVDVERNRPGAAVAHAGEALGYAELLERATEMLLAHTALARAHGAGGDAAAARRHAEAAAGLAGAPVAQWARQRVASDGSRR